MKRQIDFRILKRTILCGALASGLDVEELKSKTRKPEAVIGRNLVMHVLNVKMFHSFSAIGRETFGMTHASVMHGIKEVKAKEKINDSLFMPIKKEFDRLINITNMDQLLEECARREEQKIISEEEKRRQIKELHSYIRKYKKCVSKLIRTEEKLPSKRDFDLLEHILSH